MEPRKRTRKQLLHDMVCLHYPPTFGDFLDDDDGSGAETFDALVETFIKDMPAGAEPLLTSKERHDLMGRIHDALPEEVNNDFCKLEEDWVGRQAFELEAAFALGIAFGQTAVGR